MVMMETLTKNTLEKYKIGSGKVRNKYSVPNAPGLVLMLTTDRISAFDRVIGEIKGKGAILNFITIFLKNIFRSVIQNDIVYAHDLVIAKMYGYQNVDSELKGRLCIVRKAEVIPIECIVRFVLEGSLWKEYKKIKERGGTIWGIKFPRGLKKGDVLPYPVFTPSTKASIGHDVNISYEEMVDIVNIWLKENLIIGDLGAMSICQSMRATSLAMALIIRKKVKKSKCDLLDTKFEMGLIYDCKREEYQLCLIDEVLTPDSSRLLFEGDHTDKQILRDFLEKEALWDKESEPPAIPVKVAKKIIQGYRKYKAVITA
jgi:phosphoribosylaminoimidazole-succinocarboxamide synthase